MTMMYIVHVAETQVPSAFSQFSIDDALTQYTILSIITVQH